MTRKSDDFDYDSDVPVGGNALAVLASLAQEQADAEAKIARLEAELAAAREEHKRIAEGSLPAAMEEIGMEHFRTKSGFSISIESKVRASISKTREDEAYSWLKENGAARLIKSKVSIEFGKGQEQEAAHLVANLGQMGLPVEEKISVHANSLTAWVKEQLALGKELPMDLLGVFRQKVAKIAKD
jgi:hypothetical protein